MLFLSPAVLTSEDDQTLYTTQVANKVGAIAGAFQWGPVDAPTQITNGEKEFVAKFGIPDNVTYPYVMPLLDFFSYSKAAWVVRQVGAAARNAFPTGQTAELVKNDDAFDAGNFTGSDFIAKYPGVAGNGLAVVIIDQAHFDGHELANQFTYVPIASAGEYAIAVVDTTGYWTGTAQKKQKESLYVTGSATASATITVFGVPVTVAANDTASAVAAKIAGTAGIVALFDSVVANGSIVTYVEKTAGYSTVTPAPAAQNGVAFATTIVDPGSLGGVLEKYELMTSNPAARFADGTTQYYVDAINKGSKYIRVGDKSIALSNRTVVLAGGVDDQVVNVTEGFQLFANREAYDIQFLIAPAVSEAEQKAIIDVAETRMDCMPFVAPMLADVVNNRGNEVASVLDWRQNRLNKDSNYSFAVDNWGYMYDKYNDVYRWIPATGGTAGIFARTFVNNDPWISPAGLTRGKYLNYTKMAWSASEDDRNALYPFGINSIVTFPSDGIVLYGDKTLTQRPSAFSRVNVRWAFIVAKQSVAAMARYYLFELNDASTRAQFVNAATPFLRNMKNRRAFEDFRVICNADNNDADTRLQNKFVVQLLLKPTYSINWVILNLSAIRPDVAFTENS
jgi:phage tail sheath protein FI